MKKYILVFSMLFLFGCTPSTTNIRYFQDYVDCVCPDQPQFSKIENKNHIGSVEMQEQITQRTLVIIDYSEKQKACIQCFKSQIKKEKK